MSETDAPALAFDTPDEALFFAVAWCDRPGAEAHLEGIRRAHADGAHLDGTSEDGETPLTAAILGGRGAPRAVALLLELGADPSRRDANGWTPWGACVSRIADRVVRERMEAIQDLLAAAGADRGDEPLLAFEVDVDRGNTTAVERALAAGLDPNARIIGPLAIAVRNDDHEMAALLLAHGADPEGTDTDEQAEPPLIRAATAGHLEMVQRLVHAGARPDRFAYGDPACTAELLAREAGHDAVADWLRERGGSAASREETPLDRDPRFAALYAHHTNGIHCGLTTDGVVAVLKDWDARFGIEISDVSESRLTVAFRTLPEDLSGLAQEIHAFCPDVVEQGFGCMDEMVEMYEETGREVPPHLQPLIEGIDFTKEGFGLEILARDLKARRQIVLWWD